MDAPLSADATRLRDELDIHNLYSFAVVPCSWGGVRRRSCADIVRERSKDEVLDNRRRSPLVRVVFIGDATWWLPQLVCGMCCRMERV
jgi:hypothetical protein